LIETPKIQPDDPEASNDVSREWLVTNGLGGYASGTVAGALTRRYHGLLIAGLPNPLGRTMMLDGIAETLGVSRESRFSVGTLELMGLRRDDTAKPTDFVLEDGLPVWTYRFGDHLVEKRIFMDHGYNTVHVCYRLRQGNEPLQIELRPGVSFRPHDAPVQTRNEVFCCVKVMDGEIEMSTEGFPPLRILSIPAAEFVEDRKTIADVLYRVEASRGYDSEGSLWSPGYFRATLTPGETLILTATAEPMDGDQDRETLTHFALESERRQKLLDRVSESLRNYPPSELVYAADQFVIVAPRVDLRHKDVGDERTVIAGYHWFTDWGRDTMISLEGLTLVAGRHREARAILRTFAQHVQHGLIPNMFPEGESEGLYHTADATLWFFHGISRYEKYTGDLSLVHDLFPTLKGIIEAHVQGTLFGIHVDPEDQLLSQGAEGYQLTWMDAKVGDWVVTPRRGKAVEINALWYNALMWMAEWAKRERASVDEETYVLRAQEMRKSFNRRFWYADGNYLYDVIDGFDGVTGDDNACRPNQVFAISLPHPVLDEDKWQSVMDTVTAKLLTPVGLRSLSPDHPNYSAKYFGDLRSRDAAYHQGTVWAWLIGPYIDAWLRLNPGEETRARAFLEGFVPHLNQACVGSISEVFDAEAPHTPRGCIAQAWSVAEVLRCWQLTSAIPEQFEQAQEVMSEKSR
jgi:predicted glycogen debranching enzyme